MADADGRGVCMDKMLPLFVCGIAYFISRDAFIQARSACFVAAGRTRCLFARVGLSLPVKPARREHTVVLYRPNPSPLKRIGSNLPIERFRSGLPGAILLPFVL